METVLAAAKTLEIVRWISVWRGLEKSDKLTIVRINQNFIREGRRIRNLAGLAD